jgi:phage baseplate assembly protein W
MTIGFSTEQPLELKNLSLKQLVGRNSPDVRRVSLRFVDLNNSYGESSDKIRLEGKDAIKAQIRNILSTPIGSEAFEPDYGSLLPFRLFETVSSITAWQIENDVILAVSRWMAGRISVNRSRCKAEPFESNGIAGYQIRLVYSEIQTGEVSEYGFFVSR